MSDYEQDRQPNARERMRVVGEVERIVAESKEGQRQHPPVVVAPSNGVERREPTVALPCGCRGPKSRMQVNQIDSNMLQFLVNDPTAPLVRLVQCMSCKSVIALGLAKPEKQIIEPGIIVPGR